ncbi:MAG: hypothetical protein HGA95_04310 [Caldiserica bacterium]|nr:hypothetical protein [Caldisericota bacterium]
MKYTWITFGSIFFAILAVALYLLPLGAVSTHTIWLAQFPLIIMMDIIVVSTYSKMIKENHPEKNVWLSLLFAGFFLLIGEGFYSAGNVMVPQSSLLVTIGAAMIFCAYASFIIGLWLMAIHLRTISKQFNVWVPILVIFVLFVTAGFFLWQEFIKSNQASSLMQIANFFFLVPDFFLVVVSLLVVLRTQGGRLSQPYLVLGMGCIGMVVFHLLTVFFMSQGQANTFIHWIRLVFNFAVALLAVGCDMRFQLQKDMESFEK